MGRARQTKGRRQRGTTRGLPGWAMLLIGLIIGLFVAFLVYLDGLGRPAMPPAQPADIPQPATGDTERTASGNKQTGKGRIQPPEFEFYSILPDLEVVVPNGGDKDEKDKTATASSSQQQAAPERTGTYYIQVGSFQHPEQADRMKARVTLLGLNVSIQRVVLNGQEWHRVRVGPYTERARLRAAQERLDNNDIDYLVVRVKPTE